MLLPSMESLDSPKWYSILSKAELFIQVALECAGSGVTVNSICPGWVETELVVKQIEARAKEVKTQIRTQFRKISLMKKLELLYYQKSNHPNNSQQLNN